MQSTEYPERTHVEKPLTRSPAAGAAVQCTTTDFVLFVTLLGLKKAVVSVGTILYVVVVLATAPHIQVHQTLYPLPLCRGSSTPLRLPVPWRFRPRWLCPSL